MTDEKENAVRKPAVSLTNVLGVDLMREIRARLLEAHKVNAYNTFELDKHSDTNVALWVGVDFDFPELGIKSTKKCGFVLYTPEPAFTMTEAEKAKFDLAVGYNINVMGMDEDKAFKSAKQTIIRLRGK